MRSFVYISLVLMVATIVFCVKFLQVSEKSFTKKSSEKSTVYIDVGANRGDTLRLFYKERMKSTNQKEFKIPYEYDPTEWKVFAFEADPIHSNELLELRKKYHFQLYNETAVWINTDGITLYPDRQAETKGYWGSSISKTKKDVDNLSPINVKSIDFSKWLGDHVTPDDFVVMKMNIEGAEFESRLENPEIDQKVLEPFCAVDILYQNNR
uniref:Uncharacterized protein LOC102810156 n=1 Tax=Saccoglossus kowalevskii TaxID=10224 RepID=A0ABM0M1X1_SACKO|nr:PREDICTED: uncharacterized protein LOC102810156 [Saccoglossus kowalevskii]